MCVFLKVFINIKNIFKDFYRVGQGRGKECFYFYVYSEVRDWCVGSFVFVVCKFEFIFRENFQKGRQGKRGEQLEFDYILEGMCFKEFIVSNIGLGV